MFPVTSREVNHYRTIKGLFFICSSFLTIALFDPTSEQYANSIAIHSTSTQEAIQRLYSWLSSFNNLDGSRHDTINALGHFELKFGKGFSGAEKGLPPIELKTISFDLTTTLPPSSIITSHQPLCNQRASPVDSSSFIMRLLLRPWSISTVLTSCLLASLPGHVFAERSILSSSLNPCQPVNNFTASLFNVYFTPDNASLSFNVVGVAAISGNVTALVEVIAYGYTAVKQSIDPCAQGITQLCPLNPGQIQIQSNIQVSPEVISKVPGITYGIPDLDGVVRVYVFNDQGVSIACVEADLSNGKTVYQKTVGWAIAIVAGLGLVASAVTSGLGHSNTAAHVAANALSLFGYFQAQALIGMTAVPQPPIVRAWTQNFQWSMGIIQIQFMQNIFTWYQKATGGTPMNMLSTLSTTSVQVQKRSLEFIERGLKVANVLLNKRDTDANGNQVSAVKVVRGMSRVSFIAQIEITNFFLTGIAFFLLFILLVVAGVTAFKGYTELAANKGWIRPDRFRDFRNGWLWVLKGIMYRIALIAFPQIVVLCLWEITQRDSAAEVVLAVSFFIAIVGLLVWASFKVVAIAKRSVVMHKSPAYILYSDPATLNKWGFLYVQFRATAYYFIIPVMMWLALKGAFIALGQGSGLVQAIALVIIELTFLVLVCYYRPWMDKKMNWFNISIAVVNFINVIILLIFTGAFNQPVSLPYQ